MDRHTRRLFVAALAIVILGGVAITLYGGSSPGATPSSSPPSAPTIDGIVVKVDSTGLSAVSAFTLRTDDGRTLIFGLARLGDAVRFPPGHLAEHLATAARVRVWYEQTSSGLDALWLDDAPPR